MLFNELIQEFLFDCKIRDLSEVTIYNYSKQLSLFERYLSEKHGVTLLEQLTTQQIKYYIRSKGASPLTSTTSSKQSKSFALMRTERNTQQHCLPKE